MMASTRTRLAALAVILLIFGAGLAVGMVLDRGIAEAAPEETRTAEAEKEEEETEARRRGSVIGQIDLTSDQQVRVDSIVDHFREELKNFRTSYRTEYDRILTETREALKAILDDEQRAEYEALLEERDRQRQR
jgi:Spy/CpxP family protein refolding chaperone